ncbi:MAG: transposase [Oligoflexus sp.]
MAEKKKQKRYTKEFKVEAVKLVVEKGMKVSEVAKDLGISQPALGSWVKESQQGGQDTNSGKASVQSQEEKIRQLEQQVKRLTMEREILKKAMAYFVEIPK